MIRSPRRLLPPVSTCPYCRGAHGALRAAVRGRWISRPRVRMECRCGLSGPWVDLGPDDDPERVAIMRSWTVVAGVRPWPPRPPKK